MVFLPEDERVTIAHSVYDFFKRHNITPLPTEQIVMGVVDEIAGTSRLIQFIEPLVMRRLLKERPKSKGIPTNGKIFP